MKRFLVFAGDIDDPRGGWEDFRVSFDTLEEARGWISGWCAGGETRAGTRWGHVVDATKGKIVAALPRDRGSSAARREISDPPRRRALRAADLRFNAGDLPKRTFMSPEKRPTPDAADTAPRPTGQTPATPARSCGACRWFGGEFVSKDDPESSIGHCHWPAERLPYSLRYGNRERMMVEPHEGAECPCFEPAQPKDDGQ